MWWSRTLVKKIDKIEVNIKTYHIICGILRDFNLKNHGIRRLHMEQSLKVIILQKIILKKVSSL